ncbi:hypothetical protein BH20ACT18_BH20ACT18_02250 [soil metagenome]
MRRAASPFVALAVLLALGCGAENEESGPTTTTTPHTPMAGTVELAVARDGTVAARRQRAPCRS